ncbi:hypothetical protein [Tomitella gaofuii]|uniref:hypothetical protein n=1 Tax=Tomitella gaofuii TaxID=2760083 RepID=UPI0015F98102|nr:hypothetical protein [Tomitella gaofuii]
MLLMLKLLLPWQPFKPVRTRGLSNPRTAGPYSKKPGGAPETSRRASQSSGPASAALGAVVEVIRRPALRLRPGKTGQLSKSTIQDPPLHSESVFLKKFPNRDFIFRLWLAWSSKVL